MSADPQRKWGILLASGDNGEPLEGAVSACASALDQGAIPFLYLLHDGTRHVHHPALQRMRARGLRLYCCSFNARRRGIETDDAAIYCGLGILADILASVDRFLSFTGSRWTGRNPALARRPMAMVAAQCNSNLVGSGRPISRPRRACRVGITGIGPRRCSHCYSEARVLNAFGRDRAVSGRPRWQRIFSLQVGRGASSKAGWARRRHEACFAILGF